MTLYVKSFPNLYKDSVSLMQISAKIAKMDGILHASAAMGTPANIERMRDGGMPVEVDACPNDLLVVVEALDEAAASAAFEAAEADLSSNVQNDSGDDGVRRLTPISISMGVEANPDANLALISVPGTYAAAEALKALSMGLHVMMFSDNVKEEDERFIKQYAFERGLLVMGPDCGTAIINGLPLGFANVVEKGAIGVVAASGTGLQEVVCRIDALGAGVSQAIGTGGRDLHEMVGGLTMLQGIKMLSEDEETKVIVLISKPPHPSVARKVLDAAKASGKPVVVHFLGADAEDVAGDGITAAGSLAEAAEFAAAILEGRSVEKNSGVDPQTEERALEAASLLGSGQTDVRGVFAGGTFCYEAQLALKEAGFTCESNAPISGGRKLADKNRGTGHSIVDMGDDEFTQGRPHPMIDPALRNERMMSEALDEKTAVVLFDVVLGYGAHEDPAQGLVELLGEIKHKLAEAGRSVVFISHVCGTKRDIQNREKVIEALKQAGVVVAASNIEAARLAAVVLKRS